MTTDTWTQKQIELYRRMTGEERLLIGLRMHELACEVARDGIRARFPDASPEMIEEKLRERLRLSYRQSYRQTVDRPDISPRPSDD